MLREVLAKLPTEFSLTRTFLFNMTSDPYEEHKLAFRSSYNEKVYHMLNKLQELLHVIFELFLPDGIKDFVTRVLRSNHNY
jgi:hypothetical protein